MQPNPVFDNSYRRATFLTTVNCTKRRKLWKRGSRMAHLKTRSNYPGLGQWLWIICSQHPISAVRIKASRNFICNQLPILKLCWNDENKEKGVGKGPFLKIYQFYLHRGSLVSASWQRVRERLQMMRVETTILLIFIISTAWDEALDGTETNIVRRSLKILGCTLSTKIVKANFTANDAPSLATYTYTGQYLRRGGMFASSWHTKTKYFMLWL